MRRVIIAALFLYSCTGAPAPVNDHKEEFDTLFARLQSGVTPSPVDTANIVEISTPEAATPEHFTIEVDAGSLKMADGRVLPQTIEISIKVHEDGAYTYTMKSKGTNSLVDYHVVKKGETISTIAEKYGVSVKCVNNGNAKININQTIKIRCND